MYNDILLSFYDEEVRSSSHIEDINYFLSQKYTYIFMTINGSMEEKIIKRNFMTDYSLYLDEQLSCVVNKIDYSLVEVAKEEYGLGIFNEKVKGANELYYSSLPDKAKKRIMTSSLCAIRAAILLLDEEKFTEFLKSLKDNKELMENFDKIFEVDFTSVLKKDRERHKKLSIILTK